MGIDGSEPVKDKAHVLKTLDYAFALQEFYAFFFDLSLSTSSTLRVGGSEALSFSAFSGSDRTSV